VEKIIWNESDAQCTMHNGGVRTPGLMEELKNDIGNEIQIFQTPHVELMS
jgi:hypothetical protein